MTMYGKRFRLILSLVGLAACGPGTELPDNPDGGSLYAISSTLFSNEGATTYVNLFNSLDVSAIDASQAREYPGAASIASYGDWLFVSDGEAPIINRFTIASDGRLEPNGRLSFANYGLTRAPMRWNVFISATKAYMFDYQSRHIIWNPTTMEIVGEIDTPQLVRQGYTLDGSDPIVRGDRMLRTFTWVDWVNYEFVNFSALAVFDLTTDRLVSIVEDTRCIGLVRADMTENRDIFFSPWAYSVPYTLLRKGPRNCALRVLNGTEQFDPNYKIVFSDATEGREGASLGYMKQDQGFINVFHSERVEIKPDTDWNALAASENWRLWSVDLNRGEAALVEDIPWSSGGYTHYRIDGRFFVLIASADYARTTAYELVNGAAIRRFETRGFVYELIKLR